MSGQLKKPSSFLESLHALWKTCPPIKTASSSGMERKQFVLSLTESVGLITWLVGCMTRCNRLVPETISLPISCGGFQQDTETRIPAFVLIMHCSCWTSSGSKQHLTLNRAKHALLFVAVFAKKATVRVCVFCTCWMYFRQNCSYDWFMSYIFLRFHLETSWLSYSILVAVQLKNIVNYDYNYYLLLLYVFAVNQSLLVEALIDIPYWKIHWQKTNQEWEHSKMRAHKGEDNTYGSNTRMSAHGYMGAHM